MTSCKSRKGPTRLRDSARGAYANRHGRAVAKNHELLGSKVARLPPTGWHDCATLARAAQSPRAQGHARIAARGHRDLNAIR